MSGEIVHQGTKRTLSGSSRPKHSTMSSKASTAGFSTKSSATSMLQDESPVTPEIFQHIDAIKHIDDKLIFELLRSARFYANMSTGSTSSLDSSRRSSQVPSLYSDDTASISSSAMFSLGSKPSLSSLRAASAKAESSLSPMRAASTKPDSSLSPMRAASSSKAETSRMQLGRSKSHMGFKSDHSEPSSSRPVISRSQSTRHDSVTQEKPLPPVPFKHTHAHSMPTPATPQPTKNYACTFCDQTFKHRAYWLTHEEELHEQPRRWTCPDCYRSFFAEKKYRKHHYESHGCTTCALKKDAERSLTATERCSVQGVIEGKEGKPVRSKTCAEKSMLRVHNKKAYGCGFCITLCRSWSERCEHVARHFEAGLTKSDWCFTNVVKSLLLQSELATVWERFMSKEHGTDRAAWPTFVWDRREARDLVRSMEQNGMVHEKVKAIAQNAYDLAHSEESSTAEEPAASTERPKQQQTPAPEIKYLQPNQHTTSEQRPHSTPDLSQHPFHRSPNAFSVYSMPAASPAFNECHPRASKEFELLSQAIDEHLASGPMIADFDFNPNWDPMSMSPQPQQDDIVAFTHPGAYSAYTATEQDKNPWPV